MDQNPLDGSWHHLAIVWELLDRKCQMYLDGIFITEFTRPDWSDQSISGDLFIGQNLHQMKDWGTTDSFKGRMTSFNMWNYKFSNVEIASLVQNCRSRPGNIFQWHEIIARENLRGEVKLLQPSSCMYDCLGL